MNRRNWLWSALVAVPLAIAGVVYANANSGYTCPLTGEKLACENCCPLNKKTEGYTCPVTGEQLPCEKCCPLNKAATASKTEEKKTDAPAGFICPVTGEQLPCEKCCPLNR